ncbi:DNA-3-methyladenine glycosylase I [Catenovulum sediminis]|uniref:DNA-3-methyladenine glycosylase I n=1 Tax=Catenovulum sediminis TaxID=1740262 RepID=A0ABV1RK52_9ALTE|nr:DNA-3-methyladenine glycosylase I [Catenovulum sediminis]
MEKFSDIYQRALERKGGKLMLEQLLPAAPASHKIAELTDDRVLSAFSKKVFQSGFVWRVVEQKWPAFEDSFFNFDIQKVLLMPPDMLERKASDPAIIRNAKKVMSIYENALMINDVQQAHGHSFAKFLAEWPKTSIIELWLYLKKHGCRLGGNTGPYSLRALGIDTFLLTQDVEAYFRAHKLIEGGLSSKRSLLKIQQCFNHWQQESGYDLQQISQTIAYSVGDNYVGIQNA